MGADDEAVEEMQSRCGFDTLFDEFISQAANKHKEQLEQCKKEESAFLEDFHVNMVVTGMVNPNEKDNITPDYNLVKFLNKTKTVTKKKNNMDKEVQIEVL